MEGEGEVQDQQLVNEDIMQLKRVWQNEKVAPELLPYEFELVKRVQEQLDMQKANLEAEDDDDEPGAQLDRDLRRPLCQMEIERIRFMLTSYLRTRLRKLERFPFQIARSEELIDRLSEAEQAFLEGYVQLVEAAFTTPFLGKLPEKLARLVDKEVDMIPEANLDSHVLFRALEPLGAFPLSENEEDEPVLLEEEDVVVSRYRPISGLLKEGRVELL